jgi:hypothetical protein
MIILLLIVLILVGIGICRKIKKANIEKNNKILKIIVVINIIVICILKIILPFVNYINIYGLVILVLINIIVFILSKKLSINKITLIITLAVYFILSCFVPLYKFDEHIHTYDYDNIITTQLLDGTQIEDPLERIEEYTIYYNCYNIKFLEKEY